MRRRRDSLALNADVPGVKILDVSRATAGEGSAAIPYCLVKVLVPQAINIWVGLPMNGKWNGRLESEGGGGYSGNLTVPNVGLTRGYVAVSSDAGHAGDAIFGMLSPGRPNTALQIPRGTGARSTTGITRRSSRTP